VGKPGLKKVHRYSVEFKVTAVKLSHMAGVEVQTVANALDIHPFMLSRWRKEVRDGVLKGRARRVDLPSRPAREIKELQALKRDYALLKEEHELLKKAIRFCSERRWRSSRSSTASANSSSPSGYVPSTA
jgi:transposase